MAVIIDNIYNDFNIISKIPIHKLFYHKSIVNCLTLMKDGRLASGSYDDSIIIFNKETFKPDFIIKEHTKSVNCIIQLSSGILASCSSDKSIKLFNIKGNEYEVLQTLNHHTDTVYKIIELKNKTLASCSDDSSIIFYIKDNLEYKNDYRISIKRPCYSIIQTKENEICYCEDSHKIICFLDLLERQVKASISNITNYDMIMISNDFLIVPGENKISIININCYKLERIIDVPEASYINGVCLLNQNMLLTGDFNGCIRQWKIEGNNLILISKKEEAHVRSIKVLLNLENGHIASASTDWMIKIW